MKSMMNNLNALYNGIAMINGHYSRNEEAVKYVIPSNVKNSFERYKIVKGYDGEKDIPEIDRFYNIGSPDEPFYLVTVKGVWDTVVDRVSNGIRSDSSPFSYLVMIPTKIFTGDQADDAICDLFTAYHDLLTFDPCLSVEPNHIVLNEGDGDLGHLVPSYDFEITLAMVLFVYQNLNNWFEADAKETLYSVLRLHHYEETTINDIVDFIIRQSGDNLITNINNGIIMNIIYQ